jgi:hypothetical protein
MDGLATGVSGRALIQHRAMGATREAEIAQQQMGGIPSRFNRRYALALSTPATKKAVDHIREDFS